MLHGKPLEEIILQLSKQRPFVLENIGFQQQIVELEAILNKLNATEILVREHAQLQFKSHWKQRQYALEIKGYKRIKLIDAEVDNQITSSTERDTLLLNTGTSTRTSEYDSLPRAKVEIELLIPGLCTIEAKIPVHCTIKTVKKYLIHYANHNLLLFGDEPAKVAKSWLVLAMFGFDDMYDIPLEAEAVETKVQLDRMKSMFGLSYEWKGELYLIFCLYIPYTIILEKT